jgi:hypothetical protein
MIALRGGGLWEGPEDGAFVNGINALIKREPREVLHFLTDEDIR